MYVHVKLFTKLTRIVTICLQIGNRALRGITYVLAQNNKEFLNANLRVIMIKLESLQKRILINNITLLLLNLLLANSGLQ